MSGFREILKDNGLMIRLLGFVFIFIGIYYIYLNISKGNFSTLLDFNSLESDEDFFGGYGSALIHIFNTVLFICTGLLLLLRKNIGWYMCLILLLSVFFKQIAYLVKMVSILNIAFQLVGFSYFLDFIAFPIIKISIAVLVFILLNSNRVKQFCFANNKYFVRKFVITMLIGSFLGVVNILNYVYSMFFLTGKIW